MFFINQFFIIMNIFVANLNYKVRSENLKQIFSEYGEVTDARIINEKGTRRSKGFGFVEMASEEDARKAIAALDGAEWEGRNIIVKEALPRPEDTAPAPVIEPVSE
jgi:RNA recognition motif-containing protein